MPFRTPTQTLYRGTLVTGDDASAPWCNVTVGPTPLLVQLVILAGSGTLVVEGRMSSDFPPVLLASKSASDGVQVPRYPQVRVRLANGTTCSALGSAGETVESVE